MISVIIPSYNHEKYIGRCIDSVLNQTFQNFELIIIDDASEDKSWEIINSFSDDRICSYKLPSNHGAYYAQNKGIELAKHDYISILNSDDFYFENRLANCLSFIQDHDADFVGTDIELIDSEDVVINENWWTNSFDLQKKLFKQNNSWYTTLFTGNIFMTTSNFFFRKCIFHEIGGFNNFKYVLDYDFTLRSLFAGFRFQWVDEPLLKYRLHDKNTILSKPVEVNKEASSLIRKSIINLPFNCNDVRDPIKEGIYQLEKFETHIEQTLIFDYNDSLNKLNSLIFERDKQIAECEKSIIQRDKWVADRDKWIAERDKSIIQRDKWIADRDDWISQRDNVIHNLIKNLEEINSSFIYKLTKFLSRIFSSFFKSGK